MSLINGLFKTIFHINSKFCLPGDLNNEMQSRVFLSVTDEWPFKD